MTQLAAIQQLAQIRSFLLAGHAKFTLVSKKTGDRKTFLVEKAPARPGELNAARASHDLSPMYFAKLLVGPNNGEDFKYLACVFQTDVGELKTKQNKDRWGTEAFSALLWMLGHINGSTRPNYDERWFFEQVEFWHAGECGRCGRELTDPESIARGLGPVCAERS